MKGAKHFRDFLFYVQKATKSKWPLFSALNRVCTAGGGTPRWVWEVPQQGKLQSWHLGLCGCQGRVFAELSGQCSPQPLLPAGRGCVHPARRAVTVPQ